MRFVLFRHAQKGIMPFEDPELSPNGFMQADHLLKLVHSDKIPKPEALLVSPKRRTSQTFYKISKEYNLPCQVRPDLNQRESDETSQQFKDRIQNFLNSLVTNTSQTTVFACTHYDWIEEAMTLIHCDRDLNSFEFMHWSPTQYIEFEIQNTIWKFIQKGDAK